MKTTYLHGGTLLTMNARADVLADSVVEIKAGKITAVRSDKNFKPPADAVAISTKDCLVTPGFVNAHTHTGMTLLRGIADDMPLRPWLEEKIFPLEAKWGKPDFVYFGTLLAAAEMIKSGTTCFNDMYYFEESAAKAVHEAGLRAICGQTIVEISDVQKPNDELFEKFDKYLSDVAAYPLVKAAIAPHSIYGVSDKTWQRVIEYARKRKLSIHVHLAETQQEEDHYQKKLGLSPTEYFERIGLWESQALAAHSTCVTEKGIAILGKYKVGIAYNPESNLKLGTKICPVVELREAGANVALGTDGVASNNNLDLLQEADFAAKLQVFRKGVGALTTLDTVKLLTSEGASALGLGQIVGSIEVGKEADLVAVDTLKPHAAPLYNPYSHLVYSATGADVKHVLVQGRVLLQDYRLTTLDEAEIIREARRWGEKIAAT